VKEYSTEDEKLIAELDEDFKDDADYASISTEEKLRIIRVMDKMMDIGMAAIYGDEAPDEPDADVPCNKVIDQCKAKFCTFIFALTKDEVKLGHVKTNPDKPYFITREKDEYCPHLNREKIECEVWENRPLRCRRYDCRDFEGDVWSDGMTVEFKKNQS